MVFSSLLFLFRFLPAVLILYYLVPGRFKNTVLFLVSLVFYAWGEPVYVLLMIAAILVSYLGGLAVHNLCAARRRGDAKFVLLLTCIAELGMLGYFKYANFVIRTVNQVAAGTLPVLNLALPIGISFYTFQTLSYVIDVFRGTANVQKNIISYGAYVTMFPQLIAGPIVQYKTIDAQLRRREHTAEQFADGVNRFVIGLGKKVLLANNAGALWDMIKVMEAGNISVLMAWMGILAYTFQIYFDFSAYSDMAIGLGSMLGFKFLENFQYPYMSRSVTEFWRRWHISLGTWFREYVYIPLGGNRVSRGKHIRNIMIVWLLTGIWHGADWNFLVWGVYYGIILLAEKYIWGRLLEKLPGPVRSLYCMILVIFGWFIFSYADNAAGTGYLLAMFGAAGNSLAGGESLYLLLNNVILFLLLIAGSTDLPARIGRRILTVLEGSDTAVILVRGVFYLAVMLLSTAYLVDASYNPFLYFRF